LYLAWPWIRQSRLLTLNWVGVFIGSLGEFAVTRPARPSKGTTIREANGIPAKAMSTSCAIGNNIASRQCPKWILCCFVT